MKLETETTTLDNPFAGRPRSAVRKRGAWFGLSLCASFLAQGDAWAQVHENCYPEGVSKEHAPDPNCDPSTGEQKPPAATSSLAPLQLSSDSLWGQVYPGQILWNYTAFETTGSENGDQELYSRVSCSVEGTEIFKEVYYPSSTKTPYDANEIAQDQFQLQHGQLVEVPQDCEVGGFLMLETFFRDAGFSSDLATQQVLGMVVEPPKVRENSEGAQYYTYVFGQGPMEIRDVTGRGQASELMMLGLSPEDVKISAKEDDILLTINGVETIRLMGQRKRSNGSGVEWVVFVKDETETRWGRQELRDRANADAKPSGVVAGSWHSDNYEHRFGDGSYTILDYGPPSNLDTLVMREMAPEDIRVLGDGNDVVVNLPGNEVIRLVKQRSKGRIQGLESIVFPDAGAEVSWNRSDLLNRAVSGMKATGQVKGSWHAETYEHTPGDGSYEISDYGGSGSLDTLILNGLSPENVGVQGDGNDIVLTLPGNEVIRLVNQRSKGTIWGLESIVFPDAGAEVSWNRRDLLNRAVSGMKATGQVKGSWHAETYEHTPGDGSYEISDYGGSGNLDTLILNGLSPENVGVQGDGKDIVLTLPGNEVIRLVNQRSKSTIWGLESIVFPDAGAEVSWNRRDLLNRAVSGMKATGQVKGSWHAETYEHTPGDGSYEISDYGRSSNLDTLILNGLSPEDVGIQGDGNDIVLTLPGNEVLRLVNQRNGKSYHGLENIVFPDAGPEVTWTRSELAERIESEVVGPA